MTPTLTAPSAGSTATATASIPEKYPFFPDNIEFWFEAKRAFGAASYGSSEFGEVMASLNRITSGDYESWYNEWNATAERISAEADAQLAAGHRVSARDGSGAHDELAHTGLGRRRPGHPSHARHQPVRLRRAFLLLTQIPYENTTLPGYLHRVDESNTQRPLLILHTGFDGQKDLPQMSTADDSGLEYLCSGRICGGRASFFRAQLSCSRISVPGMRLS